MERTDFVQHLAPVAVAARPYAGFGICLQWRNGMAVMGQKSTTTNAATKRTARHLGMAPT